MGLTKVGESTQIRNRGPDLVAPAGLADSGAPAGVALSDPIHPSPLGPFILYNCIQEHLNGKWLSLVPCVPHSQPSISLCLSFFMKIF
jgi:hypothetical protein